MRTNSVREYVVSIQCLAEGDPIVSPLEICRHCESRGPPFLRFLHGAISAPKEQPDTGEADSPAFVLIIRRLSKPSRFSQQPVQFLLRGPRLDIPGVPAGIGHEQLTG